MLIDPSASRVASFICERRRVATIVMDLAAIGLIVTSIFG
jgi:hypothetical protein